MAATFMTGAVMAAAGLSATVGTTAKPATAATAWPALEASIRVAAGLGVLGRCRGFARCFRSFNLFRLDVPTFGEYFRFFMRGIDLIGAFVLHSVFKFREFGNTDRHL